MATKDAYIAKMKIQLDELNTTMEELDAKADHAKEEAREKYKAEIVKLRHQSKLALGKLDEMRIASENTWQDMVEGTEKVRDAFVNSFHYFKSQI